MVEQGGNLFANELKHVVFTGVNATWISSQSDEKKMLDDDQGDRACSGTCLLKNMVSPPG
ncbi:hypothetical protein V8G57_17550 [Collimonas sp. H4R21]|jgi:hypothetical protein|uniref:Uncharacterized protein n=1 Tax=Collimonas rhizosphaerae TaxID=3126357 RepID=A0ABU9PYY1_9BURK